MHPYLSFVINNSIKILLLLLPLLLLIAAYTYAERKVLAFMQNRIGPNRVGIYGILQPMADIIKLIFKEIIIPINANKILFILAPILMVTIALGCWAVIPFDYGLVIADLNVGLLYLLLLTGCNVYGVILAGWAANSRYALLGCLRATAQIIAYEIALGFAILGVILKTGSMNLTTIVAQQTGGILNWHICCLFPMLLIYFIAAVAETNRAPFDVAEAETELVAGFHVEYSGLSFALFFLAEYANMILVSVLASILFLGGWLSAFEGLPNIQIYLGWIPGIVWLGLKTLIFMLCFLWIRATLPRYRFDQIMDLGWKLLIPSSIVILLLEAIVLWLAPSI